MQPLLNRIIFERHNLQRGNMLKQMLHHFCDVTFVMMMDQSRVESTRDTYNYGQYINQLHRTPTTPNTIKVIQIQKKIW